jgi:(p)ppGpp synthase/HD superfamily hydrolase
MNNNERALNFAVHAHVGQTRKDGKTPYSVHAMGSLALALKFGLNNKEAQAAALSDVADTVIYFLLGSVFGPRVMKLVDAVTRRPDETRQQYFARIVAEDAVNVKLATALDNLNETLFDAADPNFDFYGGSRQQTVSYYLQMLEAFRGAKSNRELFLETQARAFRLACL